MRLVSTGQVWKRRARLGGAPRRAVVVDIDPQLNVVTKDERFSALPLRRFLATHVLVQDVQ